MKKLIITSAIVLAAVSSQAIDTWTDTSGGDWATAANWSAGLVPTTLDPNVRVNNMNSVWPTISSFVPDVTILGAGYDSDNTDGAATLNVVDGGKINAGSVYIGVRSTGVLNMSGGLVTSTGRVGIGWTEGVGVGTMNLTGDGVFFAAAVATDLSWTSGSVVNISDGAIFLVNGDHTGADWIANNLIVAPEAGHHIEASVDGLGRTHFVAIPEPATFGLFAGLGGALLFIRKRLMI